MTISEKKIELVQSLLLLQDTAVLFEIEKLIYKASGNFKKPKDIQTLSPMPASTFEEWVLQFDAAKDSNAANEFGMSSSRLRQRIWAAEQSPEMTAEEFFERLAQS
jgi:hypothetical protein